MQTIFELDWQEHQNWCWAAVSASVRRYLHPDGALKQCEIASELLPRQCCVEPLPEDLDATALLQDALTKVEVLKPPIGGPMQFEDLKAQLDSSLPVCARIQWVGQNRGHFVTIIGYGVASSGVEWIDIADPFFGYLCVPYDWFRDSYQELGTWSDSFLVQAPA
jgi:Papain-like cysteine protease AvrRpt2